MKKLIYRFFNFALALPITLTSIPSSLNIPTVKYAKENDVKQEAVKISKIVLNTKSPETIVIVGNALQITPAESNFDQEQRLAREEADRIVQLTRTKRDTIALDRPYRTKTVAMPTDPDLAAKRVLVQQAAAQYGIPWQILEAIWQVETGKSWDTGVRSYAGAGGPMQFMPGTWRKYGVDGNGDGTVDITSAYDSVYAAANYLAASGASSGQIERAILSYNHSSSYLHKVLGIAYELGF